VTATGVVDVPGYQELTQLDRGALATTYRGRREDGHDPVVVKVLHSEYADAPTRKALARYRQDAQRLGGQEHVLHPLDSGTTYTGQLYVVTEYCERGSMLDRLAAEGPLPVDQVLNAAVPVALALGAAHRLGLCHRSVKPSNILLRADGRPMLADFVTAALRADRFMSLDGPAPLHTAPELLSGADPTPRGDVYSLAATLYHLLAGRPPYPDRGGVAGLLLSMMTDATPRLSRPNVPDSVGEALARAMATEPDDRFPDGLAFAERLHGILTGLGGTVPNAWPAPAGAGPHPGRVSRSTPAVVAPPTRPAPPTVDAAPPATPLATAPPTEPSAGRPSEPPTPSTPTPAIAAARGEVAVQGEVGPARPPREEPTRPPEHAPEPPAPPRAPPTGSETSEAADPGTVELAALDRISEPDADAPDAGRRLRTAMVGAGLLAVVALAAVGWLAAAPGTGETPDRPAVSAPASAVAAAPTTSTSSSGRGEAQVAIPALAPSDVAVIDNGTSVGLRWTLPAAATAASIVLQQQPVAPAASQLTLLEPGTTSHPVTGLDAGTAYCFRVGVLVSVGTAGKPATVAWSEPVGVRGACTVASAGSTPS
jgi:serine/threonine-protein kinase PknK